MGFIGDLNKLNKQAKELRKDHDPSQQMDDALARMRSLNQSMEGANKALADGVPGTAEVVAVGPTTGEMNMSPMLQVELLVIPEGGMPRPVSTQLVVPPQHLSRMAVGSTLPILASPSDPNAIAIMWDKPQA